MRWIRKFRRLPNQISRLFIQGSQGALRTARCANDFVPIHQHGFGVAPTGSSPTKTGHGFLPKNLAIADIGTRQNAFTGQRKNSVAIDGWGAPGAISVPFLKETADG